MMVSDASLSYISILLTLSQSSNDTCCVVRTILEDNDVTFINRKLGSEHPHLAESSRDESTPIDN